MGLCIIYDSNQHILTAPFRQALYMNCQLPAAVLIPFSGKQSGLVDVRIARSLEPNEVIDRDRLFRAIQFIT